MQAGDFVKLRYGSSCWIGRLVTMGDKTSTVCFSPKTRELEVVENRFLEQASEAEMHESPIKDGLKRLPMLITEYPARARG